MFSRLHMIPLLPLLGAAYLILFGRRHSRGVVQTLASLAVFASFVVSADAAERSSLTRRLRNRRLRR